MARHDRKIENSTEPDAVLGENGTSTKAKTPRRKQVVLIAIALVIGAGVVDFGYKYWTSGRFMIETDDAYVTANTTLISSKVQGYVIDVPVKQNDIVRAGDVLVRLDDGDYQIALETSTQRVNTADQTINRIGAQIKAAEAGVVQAEAMQSVAEAEARAAQRDYDRAQKLVENRAASQASLDTATEGLETANASLASATAAILNAEAQVGVLRAQRAEAEGSKQELELAVKQAQRNLELTVLRAPVDGTVGNMAIETGDLVTAGVRLAALVPLNSLYIEANFKETQMFDIALGADVHITFDAIPDATFEGKIASVSPATGSVFSLLPTDNATGNFTKIVQRVPVRIDLPKEALEGGHLRAGMSAVVEVDSRTGTPVAAIAQAD